MTALDLNFKQKNILSLKLTPTVKGSELPYEDGIPLESSLHLDTMTLLMQQLEYYWRNRNDVYIAANMFVYFDPDQVKNRNFRGPDFFVVKGVKHTNPRLSWVIWEEDYLTPNFVVELTSPSTIKNDLAEKKDIYEQVLETQEYFVYTPNTTELLGWRLQVGRYEPIVPNKKGWLWSEELGLWMGVAEHRFSKYNQAVYVLRFFNEAGSLVLTKAEAESYRADAQTAIVLKERQQIYQVKQELAEEKQRADRLAAKLRELGISPD